MMERIALVLKNKINYRCSSTMQRRTGTRLITVAGKSPHKRHVQMHVRINAARKDQHAGSIDGLVCVMNKALSNLCNRLPFHEDIGNIIFAGGDNSSVP